MFEIQGKYATAKVMTDFVEDEAQAQILRICNQEMFKDASIAIMPDCHAGAGCVIGFTAIVKDKIIPNLIGVDIGCSVSAIHIPVDICGDFAKLDAVIRSRVPSGFSIRSTPHPLLKGTQLEKDIFTTTIDIGDNGSMARHMCSVGTLGGGNHFIEVGATPDGQAYLLVHTGSRNFGKRICEYHQAIATEKCQDVAEKSIRYLEGDDMQKYIEHMKVAQKFAQMNHQAIQTEIFDGMGWGRIEDIGPQHKIFTSHNYLEFIPDHVIIRKGAVRAAQGESFLLPMNMRDGTLVCLGKGNSEWNVSAPHGAGRILSRGRAKRELSVEEFKVAMNCVWSTCVSPETLDESPMAYKAMDEIIPHIAPTAEIVTTLKPVYNFKAS